MKKKLPKIAIVGSRGIPASYGGFETFAEKISLELNQKYEYDLTVVCDLKQKLLNDHIMEYEGISLKYSKFSKDDNPVLYYFDSIKKVIKDHDIIYSCGPAGGVFGFFVRIYGKTLITNPDGLNSSRSKWKLPIRFGFHVLEWLTGKLSHRVVCDSKEIECYIQQNYGCNRTDVVEYGAFPNSFIDNINFCQKALSYYGLDVYGYHLVVSRLEPENNIDIILDGYQMTDRKFPLVIIGNLKDTKYIRLLRENVKSQVVFLGGIYNKDDLSMIRACAVTYLHGHSVGGTNPSLLEAMASRNLCICHDNKFNREVIRNNGLFFKDSVQLNDVLSFLEKDISKYDTMRVGALKRIIDYYNWGNMAKKYDAIFKEIFKNKNK